MSEKLTKKEKGFVKDYLDTGNGVQAALKNYDTDNYGTAGAIASQNLKKLKIREALESHAESAVSTVYYLSQEATNEAVRLNASKDILDRAGYKAVDTSVHVNVDIDINPELKLLSDRLKDIERTEPTGDIPS